MFRNNNIVFCIILLSFSIGCCKADSKKLPPPCSSVIYCHGPLLHTIQMAKINEDSKTFVDMKMRYTVNETMKRFAEFMEKHENFPSKNAVRGFVAETFEPAGQEFEEWEPEDWIKHPKFLEKIADKNLREWAIHLNYIWKDLGRKIKPEIAIHKDQYSIIWVPNPVIVPGGRFREFYYWDSYWIVQGLLLSEMYHTVQGMLENFLYIVDHYGHIPNGGRVYYLERSQPPLMIPMIKSYFDATADQGFIARHIHTMEKEFAYWARKNLKMVTVNKRNYTLAAYGDGSHGPRPESYAEDIENSEVLKDDEKKEKFFSELKAAAESGWDFSSRWFIGNASNKGNLTNTNTRSIIPVDLNALIYWNAVILSEFNDLLGKPEKMHYYSKIASEWMEAVTAVLWHEEVGAWLDYDTLNEVKRDFFHPTNIAPLWTGCYDKAYKDHIVRLVLKYLQNKNILYPGGVPTTVEHTGEQWDFPNAWPPLQYIMIVGLNNTGDTVAKRLAYEIAERWVRSNYRAFKDTDAMFEKYDATIPGGHGSGGEYETQLGFGWSNGVILDLLDKYGNELLAEDPTLSILSQDNNNMDSSVGEGGVLSTPTTSFGQISAALIALFVSLIAGLIG